MQGKKQLSPQLFYQASLEQLVPQDNFYRKLNRCVDLKYLYQATSGYYGREGNESIDPVVFFKILLVGYLNNLNSDRALLRYCADSLSIRLYLGYDLDEELNCRGTAPSAAPGSCMVKTYSLSCSVRYSNAAWTRAWCAAGANVWTALS